MIYALRFPRALACTAIFSLAFALLGLVLAVNAFYFLLTSASLGEAYARVDALSDRIKAGRG